MFSFLDASAAQICSTNLPPLLPVPRIDLPLLNLLPIPIRDLHRLSGGAKVTLLVIVGSENLRRELGTFCYILTGLFGYACTYVRGMKGVAEGAASNIDAFKQAVLASHQATSLLDNVSHLLLEYLNACVQASFTGSLTQPGSLTTVSFENLRAELQFLP